MFGAVSRTLRVQYRIRKDYLFLAGCGYVAFGTDHLFFWRCQQALRSVGVWHDNL